MNTAGQHVIIVGAGVIGLACALELTEAGYRVTVVERGRAMEQSSWAAAGMLAVHDPENAPALLPLALASRALYPRFLARVETLSGLQVPLRTAVTLQGLPGSGSASAALPALRTAHYRFTQLEEASLDPRDLCAALPCAVVAAGAVLRQQAAVTAVDYACTPALPLQAHHGRPVVVLADGQPMEADQLLLTAGAWTGQLLPSHAPELPLAPRKGQMIEVMLAGPALPVVVRTPDIYLVPRGDGRVVIGATVEHAGFDRSIDEAAGERLWQRAAELWPPVLEGRITARWTGLRPGYAASIVEPLPLIGQLGNGAFVATGHFRNGILLAPATAAAVRALIAGEPPSLDLQPFSPHRFACTPAAAGAAPAP